MTRPSLHSPASGGPPKQPRVPRSQRSTSAQAPSAAANANRRICARITRDADRRLLAAERGEARIPLHVVEILVRITVHVDERLALEAVFAIFVVAGAVRNAAELSGLRAFDVHAEGAV